LVAVVAAAWLAQSVHLSLPIEITKDLSIPFPCQNNGCGCKDAVQCWSSCGCFSDQEKIAWAKANAVEPPEWFLEDLKTKPASARQATCGCCCCGKNKASTKPTPKQAVSKTDSETKTVWLNLKQRRNCQGQYSSEQLSWYFIVPQNPPRAVSTAEPICVRNLGPPPAMTRLPETPPPQLTV